MINFFLIYIFLIGEIGETWTEYSKFTDFAGGVWVIKTTKLDYRGNEKLSYSILPAVGAHHYFALPAIDNRIEEFAGHTVSLYNSNPQGQKFPEVWRDEICRTAWRRYGKQELTKFEIIISTFGFFSRHEMDTTHPDITLDDLMVSNFGFSKSF